MRQLGICCLLWTIASAISLGAEPAGLDQAKMAEKGFVRYRTFWVLPQRREELLRRMPAVRIVNRRPDDVQAWLEGAGGGTIGARREGTIPASPGSYRIRFSEGRRRSSIYRVRVERGYNPRVELRLPADAPSVLPRRGAGKVTEKGKDKHGRVLQSVKGENYRITYRQNQPLEATIYAVNTAAGAWILGYRDKVECDQETWKLRKGWILRAGQPALCVTDGMGTFLFSDSQLDAAFMHRLMETFTAGSLPWPGRLLERVERLGDQSLIPLVTAMLRHEKPHVRRRAAEVLARVGTAAHAPVLRGLSGVEGDKAAAATMEAAAEELEEAKRISTLIGEYDQADDRGKMSVLDELRDQAARVPTSFYEKVYAESENAGLREVAVKMMEKSGSTAVRRVLTRALSDPEPSVRRFAAKALAEMQSLESAEGIEKLLSDETPLVRAAAADALGELGLGDTVPGLLEKLQDEDKWVRHSASMALSEITGHSWFLPPEAGEKLQAEVVQRWQTWWEGDGEAKAAQPAEPPRER